MNTRARSPYWRLLIVAADATWIFIGLYALGVWKNDLITWIGAGAILQSLNEHLPALSMAAYAADGFVPSSSAPRRCSSSCSGSSSTRSCPWSGW